MFGIGSRKKLEAENAQLREAVAAQEQTIANATETGDWGSWEAWRDVIEGGRTDSGVLVNSRTAMRSSAVYRCVSIIAGALAGLPLPIYRTGSRERVPDHPLWKMLNAEPSEAMTAAVFWEYEGCSVLLKGDGFAFIDRARNNDVLGVKALDPNRMTVGRREGAGDQRLYAYQRDDGSYMGIDQSQILHVPGVGYDGLRGMSPISYAARQAVGLALAAEEYSARFFGSGAHPDVVLEASGTLTDDQINQLRRVWQSKYSGLDNSHLPMVLANGLKHSQLTMNSNDAQLIESRTFQVSDICRIFGVPPHMAGETTKASSWGSGVEHMSIGFVTWTLKPHLTRFEQELNRKLFPRGDYYCEFNTAGLLRGDSTARSDYIQKALGGSGGPGYMTVNEVRGLENLPPIDGGDALIDWAMANTHNEGANNEES